MSISQEGILYLIILVINIFILFPFYYKMHSKIMDMVLTFTEKWDESQKSLQVLILTSYFLLSSILHLNPFSGLVEVHT